MRSIGALTRRAQVLLWDLCLEFLAPVIRRDWRLPFGMFPRSNHATCIVVLHSFSWLNDIPLYGRAKYGGQDEAHLVYPSSIHGHGLLLPRGYCE